MKQHYTEKIPIRQTGHVKQGEWDWGLSNGKERMDGVGWGGGGGGGGRRRRKWT